MDWNSRHGLFLTILFSPALALIFAAYGAYLLVLALVLEFRGRL